MQTFVAQIRGGRGVLTVAVAPSRAVDLVAENPGAWVVEAPSREAAFEVARQDPRTHAALREIADRKAFRAIAGRYDLIDYQQLRALRTDLGAYLQDEPAARLLEIADAFGIQFRPSAAASLAMLLAETLAAEQRQLADVKDS
jgi:hypothetical protein